MRLVATIMMGIVAACLQTVSALAAQAPADPGSVAARHGDRSPRPCAAMTQGWRDTSDPSYVDLTVWLPILISGPSAADPYRVVVDLPQIAFNVPRAMPAARQPVSAYRFVTAQQITYRWMPRACLYRQVLPSDAIDDQPAGSSSIWSRPIVNYAHGGEPEEQRYDGNPDIVAPPACRGEPAGSSWPDPGHGTDAGQTPPASRGRSPPTGKPWRRSTIPAATAQS